MNGTVGDADGTAALPLQERVERLERELALLRERQAREPSDHGALVEVLLRDNARRRDAEERLAFAQQWIQLAQEVGGVGAYSYELATGELTWSASVYALYGLSPEGRRATLESWLAAVHPDDRPAVRAVADSAIVGGQEVRQEYRILRDDGRVRWIQDRGRVVVDEKGRPVRVVGLNIDVTELKEAQAAATHSEGSLRRVFENAIAGLAQVAPDGRFLEVNAWLCGFLGRSREELLALSIEDVTHPQDREECLALMRQVLDGTSRDFTREKRYLRPSGEAVWASAHVSLVRRCDGRPDRLVAVVVDIAARRRAEEGMREREREMRTRLDAIPQMVWSARPDGHHDLFNARWYAFTGVPPGSTDGEGWSELFHPEDRARTWETWRRCLASGEPYEIEYRLRHRSGAYRWVLGRARPIRDETGAVLRWMGTCTDIDELKRVSEALSRASALLQLIGDSTPDLIFAKDREGRLLYANASVQRATGRTLQELVGRTDRDFIDDPAEADAIAANDRRVIDGEETLDREEAFTGPGGETRHYRSVKSPLRGPDGAVIGLVGIASDVTERYREFERERLLAREVDHRAKNLLAVVRSILRLTRARDVKAFAAAVESRIDAIGRAHSLTADGRWDGADLSVLMREELEAFADAEPGRIAAQGPGVALSPPAAQALALALHELTTNAAKYGALSAPDGRLAVTWSLGDWSLGEGLRLAWRERGGPPAAAPSRTGFGSRVLHASIERQLGGRVEMDWAPEGLTCTITVPADQLARGAGLTG